MGVIQLLNGRTEVIMKDKDIIDIINESLGYECGELVEEMAKQKAFNEIYVAKKNNTDIDAYEEEIHNLTCLISDVDEIVEDLKLYMRESNRLSRDKIMEFTNKLSKELRNANI